MSPERPVALRRPEQCPHCAVYGQVKLETTIKGTAVILRWCCTACSHDWAVVGHDEIRLPNSA